VLSNLKHPNIIRLLEVHFSSNVFYFIMEWASGGSLVGGLLSMEINRVWYTWSMPIFSSRSSKLSHHVASRHVFRLPEHMGMSNHAKTQTFGEQRL